MQSSSSNTVPARRIEEELVEALLEINIGALHPDMTGKTIVTPQGYVRNPPSSEVIWGQVQRVHDAFPILPGPPPKPTSRAASKIASESKSESKPREQ